MKFDGWAFRLAVDFHQFLRVAQLHSFWLAVMWEAIHGLARVWTLQAEVWVLSPFLVVLASSFAAQAGHRLQEAWEAPSLGQGCPLQ